MTTRAALSLLNCSPRQFHYLLQAEGIPAGQRSHAGTLTAQATAAVQRLARERGLTEPQTVRYNMISGKAQIVPPSVSPAIHQEFTASVSDAEPAPWRAYEHLHAQVIALQADAERLQGACEHAYAALCEQEARLAAIEARAAVRGSWRDWLTRLFPAPRPVAVERDWPATEVYSGSVLRRA